MYPLLSLSQITIDMELARRLPRRLAYYHLALPIAQDEENITLAMAYPENRRVVDVIQTALGIPVTLVRSHPDDIRRALDNIWANEHETYQAALMGWAATPDDQSALEDCVQSLTRALSLQENISLSHASPSAFIAQVNDAHPALVVCAVNDLALCHVFISGISTSLLLVRGTFAPPRTMLLALRGHTADQRALDWVIPLAQYYDAHITLLAAANPIHPRQDSPLMSDIARLILPEHPAHVIEYGQMLASMNLRGRIKVSDGLLEDAMAQTLNDGQYDVVVIATEHKGSFVQNALTQLNTHSTHFLVIKP